MAPSPPAACRRMRPPLVAPVTRALASQPRILPQPPGDLLKVAERADGGNVAVGAQHDDVVGRVLEQPVPEGAVDVLNDDGPVVARPVRALAPAARVGTRGAARSEHLDGARAKRAPPRRRVRAEAGRRVDVQAEQRERGPECVVEHDPVAVGVLHGRLGEHPAERDVLGRSRVRDHRAVDVARHRLVLHLQDVVPRPGDLLGAAEGDVPDALGGIAARAVHLAHPGREVDHGGRVLAAFAVVSVEQPVTR